LLNNEKFFLPPPNDGSDFKELFKRLAAAGAGRQLGGDGFPAGPWTPELLAEAISEIDSNHVGVDLRTVQLWFQENDKGISAANIRWLARIFGCDDPVATSQWQMELSGAQSRLTARRREGKKAGAIVSLEDHGSAETKTILDKTVPAVDAAQNPGTNRPGKRLGLAMRSEALFSLGSPLNLPAAVFAGATTLGFLSYMTGVHSVKFGRIDGVVKEVGFLWAPNWTVVFMLLLPLFFILVRELLVFWKSDGRLKVAMRGEQVDSLNSWARRVESASSTYWAVFLVCVVFAGIIQWIEVCFIPLMEGGGEYAIDWGKIATVRPDVISVPEEVLFTGLAYMYMATTFYIFFVGLILLYTIVYDFSTIDGTSIDQAEPESQREINELSLRLMRGIFRCTVLGILVGICMKVQSSYLTSAGENIVTWLIGDMVSALHGHSPGDVRVGYRMPTHYSSLLVVVSTCVVFLYASIRLDIGRQYHMALWKMSAAVVVLVADYMLIGTFPGFSIFLGFGVLLALYCLLDPGLGRWQASDLGTELNVS